MLAAGSGHDGLDECGSLVLAPSVVRHEQAQEIALRLVSARTDSTAVRFTVRRRGDTYPAEGARGLHFPYQIAPTARTPPRSFLKGLANPIAEQIPTPEWYHSENGFFSRHAMNLAHVPLVELAVSTLDERGGGKVVDLGCGNGALLRKIYDRAGCVVPYGIDLKAQAIEHAGLVLPRFAYNFRCGNLFRDLATWDAEYFSLALLMVGRLLEATPHQVEQFSYWLRSHCNQVIVYTYDRTPGGDQDFLSELATIAGLRVVRPCRYRWLALAETS